MNVGYAGDVLVMAFNNTGEPGYSLYIPSEVRFVSLFKIQYGTNYFETSYLEYFQFTDLFTKNCHTISV